MHDIFLFIPIDTWVQATQFTYQIDTVLLFSCLVIFAKVLDLCIENIIGNILFCTCVTSIKKNGKNDFLSLNLFNF